MSWGVKFRDCVTSEFEEMWPKQGNVTFTKGVNGTINKTDNVELALEGTPISFWFVYRPRRTTAAPLDKLRDLFAQFPKEDDSSRDPTKSLSIVRRRSEGASPWKRGTKQAIYVTYERNERNGKMPWPSSGHCSFCWS